MVVRVVAVRVWAFDEWRELWLLDEVVGAVVELVCVGVGAEALADLCELLPQAATSSTTAENPAAIEMVMRLEARFMRVLLRSG